MKKLIIPLVVLAIVMIATSIAKRSKQQQMAGVGGGQSKAVSDDLYVEVSALGNLDYFYDHRLGMELAGKVLGVRTEYVGPAEYDMTAMITAFEQTLAKKNIKGVVVVGFEPALAPIIDKAVDSGIPVVTVDADLPQSKRVAFVGTGNYQAGYEGGKKLASLIGCSGKVALMTKVGQSNLEERVRGYKAALGRYDQIEIVQIVDTQSDAIVAAQVATAVLRKHPDLAGLGCVEAAGGVGAATAVREANLAGKVKIVAMDRGNDVLELIKEGTISATVAQQTALMPFYAVQILYQLNNQNIPITSDNIRAGASGVPSYVDTGVVIVDKSNYEYFMRK
ncbi:MAG TPA: substrate-binding domain-containing protein [Sedimentisphaerales bacterium]|nr:substrate-binding domain-containing protein [Sedimentisphaerales bacterium]